MKEFKNPTEKWTDNSHSSPKKDSEMALMHMKRCSTLLIIREVQLKLYQNIRWQKSMTTHSVGVAVGEMFISHTLLIGVQTGTSPRKRNLAISNKTTNAFTFWLSNSTCRKLPEGYTSNIIKWYMPKVIYYSNLFVTAKYWKQLKCPHTGEWLNKLWYIHTTEYYTAVKRTKEDLHELIRGDLQNMLSGKKKANYKTVSMLLLA